MMESLTSRGGSFHPRRRKSLASTWSAPLSVAIFQVLVLVLSCHCANALPEGFIDEPLGYVRNPTGFSFAETGDGQQLMLVATKLGMLHVFPNAINTVNDYDTSNINSVALDLSARLCTNKERGLQSVLPHPEYATNNKIYLYYTFNKYGDCEPLTEEGPVNRLSMFVLDPVTLTIDDSTEEVMLDTQSLIYGTHNAGEMLIGKDGMLYVTIGDGDLKRWRSAQDLKGLLGKVIRLTPDGGIPDDNPFLNFPGSERCNERGLVSDDAEEFAVCQEIWAYGLRNPFRFTTDPDEETEEIILYVNDVGGNVWEETSVVKERDNLGWPIMEGPCKFGSSVECDAPSPGTFKDPLHWYQHFQWNKGGAAVGIAFPPDGLWPQEFDNGYLLADFVFSSIYLITPNETNYCRECLPPRPGTSNTTFHEWKNLVTIKFGPYRGTTQALYYTSQTAPTSLRRISYSGGSNRPPVAKVTSDMTQGPLGTTITFDGSESSDPNNDAITYEWNFGDNTVEESGATATHTFNTRGDYYVTLKVTDPSGASDSAYIMVNIGSPPTARILSPLNTTTYAVGDRVWMIGEGFSEDGTALGPDTMRWEVRKHHADHFHPFHESTGNDRILLAGAPPPEDFSAATNSYLEVILTVTEAGLSDVDSVKIYPKLRNMKFTSEPSGLELFLDDFSVTTPAEVVSWENHVVVARAEEQKKGNKQYRFRAWGDCEGATERDIHVTDNMPDIHVVFDVEENITPIRLSSTFKSCTDSSPCSRCQSSCNSNSNCAGILECYTKPTGETSVPGCIGTDNSIFKWCVHPSSLTIGSAASNPGVTDDGADSTQCPYYPVALIQDPIDCTSDGNPCQMCQGHCDTDSDCAGDLVCYFKQEPGNVPGCLGYSGSESSYCTHSAFMAIPTDAPTVDPTPEPTEVPTEAPVVSETPEPTLEPTSEHTEEPTEAPVVLETPEPTLEPTAPPTETVDSTGLTSPGETPGAGVEGDDDDDDNDNDNDGDDNDNDNGESSAIKRTPMFVLSAAILFMIGALVL